MDKRKQLERLETLLDKIQATPVSAVTREAVSYEANIVRTMLELERAIAGEEPAKTVTASPVIYVDENSQIVSRVSSEQLEAIFGPAIDAIRASFKEQENGTVVGEGDALTRATKELHEGLGISNKYRHEEVWEAINKYTKARDALAARRAKGELINADFIDQENEAVVGVDQAIFKLLATETAKVRRVISNERLNEMIAKVQEKLGGWTASTSGHRTEVISSLREEIRSLITAP